MTAQPPAELTLFQNAYSRYLRAPHKHDLPQGIPARRSRVYESLLFNNVRGFVDKCFPVARSLVDSEQWLRLSQLFYERWQCRTPIFSQIPYEFAKFLETNAPDLAAPPWLPELLHYEWLELEVDLDEAFVGRAHLLAETDDALRANPTLRVQQYRWPVHKISASFLPVEPAPTILCVYRTHELHVRFMEINAVTAMLLQLLQQRAETPTTALSALADNLPQIAPEQIQRFGKELIEQLVQANVLIVEANAA